MKIKLDIIESGVNQINEISPTVIGDTLTYRGKSYDLSQLPNGAEVDADLPFTDKIKRSIDGELSISLQYFYTTQTAEPHQSMDINDYIFDVVDGKCPCPIKRKPAEVVE